MLQTYAALTPAPADAVLAAVGAGRLGGYLYRGDTGSSLLFDPPKPRFGRISAGRRRNAPWDLAVDAKTPVWLLEEHEGGLCVTAIRPDGNFDQIGWAADWTPPADPAEAAEHRAGWDAYCTKIAGKMQLGEPTALAASRNDPRPDGTRPSTKSLMRRLCALVGAPDAVVGQSLFTHAGPRGNDFVRCDARGR
ncbi:hypothetical protein [Streptomyces sp. TLI_171]|uniref:hypothetical protein n=1 Tax=Streptomyces sp. TLI_171 TaxID=1938859 RepID=UPI000C190CD5|nr:hypothetical protein [Streptomyces sp. TLI_171]RKE19017.1 hypothetical protein BX266_2318 [Streptomyces sp. TLI_171]